jgi:hypothetical protein
MSSSNFRLFSPVSILVMLFCALSAFIVYMKVEYLHMPLFPGEQSDVWTVEARVDFLGRNGPAKVNFILPQNPPGFTVIDENFVSRGFGLSVVNNQDFREAVWTLRRSQGEQALFYRIQVYPENFADADVIRQNDPPPLFPQVPDYPEPLASAIEAVLARARAESADIFTFANRLLTILTDESDENVKVIRTARPSSQWVPLVTEILAGARIPSRVVYGISLRPEVTSQGLLTWIEVNNGQRWRGFNPQTGEMGYPENFFPWVKGIREIVEAEGVRNLSVNFSTIRTDISQVELARQVENKLATGLINFTLYSLPIPTQEVYRVLLMIPLGALVMAFMRVVVGIPTFGTFTPILIALAFRETRLGWGIILFLSILLAGFLVRIALAHLRLLLVPRLGAMLIVVIGLMLVMSLLSARIGFLQGMSIALFPMVILTMTIERMSIVWEERGAAETLKETVGSLVVAVAGYYVMNDPRLMHLMSNFPELLLIVLAICLMFGSYTGYRVSEVLRFRDLSKGSTS